MQDALNQFINLVIRDMPKLKLAREEIIDYWAPDEAPLIILFAAIGRAISQQLEFSTEEEIKKIFQHIEDGISSSNRSLADATATGLVEALVAEAEIKHIGHLIEPLFGVRTKNYVERWRKFTHGETPGHPPLS